MKTWLRPLLSIFLCGTFGCATTTALAPATLLPVAGLGEDTQAELPVAGGDKKTVSGSTEVWLHGPDGVVYDVPLASLKKDGTALLIPPNGLRLETQGAPDAIIKGRSVGKAFAIGGIITGAVVVSVLITVLIIVATSGSSSTSPPAH
jgi:hypothetical protein